MAQRLTTLVTHEFDGIELGDKRLNERCHDIVKAMSKNPEKSIPENCEDWSSTKAAYRFFSHENTTREVVLEAHFKHTSERCRGRITDGGDAGDSPYPVICVWNGKEKILEIMSGENNLIMRVEIFSSRVKNYFGPQVGSRFSDVFTADIPSDCESDGKSVVCSQKFFSLFDMYLKGVGMVMAANYHR
ncbi:MAG: transposase DNA-binding-containing protein [Elusimicrobiota bacterium]